MYMKHMYHDFKYTKVNLINVWKPHDTSINGWILMIIYHFVWYCVIFTKIMTIKDAMNWPRKSISFDKIKHGYESLNNHIYLYSFCYYDWMILTYNQSNDISEVEFTLYDFINNIKYIFKIIHTTLDRNYDLKYWDYDLWSILTSHILFKIV